MLTIYLTDTEWMIDAECAGIVPSIFFSDKNTHISLAKKVCSTCKVIEPCLAYARATKQTEGVWGGLTPRERRKKKR